MTHLKSNNTEINVIKCGYMSKQGKRLSRWRERYFTLHSNAILKYYHHKSDPYPVGIIQISLANNIIKKKSEQFFIITSHRTWKLKLKSASDRDSWFDAVYNVWENFLPNANLKNDHNEHSITSSESGHVFHTVIPSETLSSVSIKYGVSESEIKTYNDEIMFGRTFNRMIGKKIIIPAKAKTKPIQTYGVHYYEEFKYNIDVSNAQLYLNNHKNVMDDEKEWWNTPIGKSNLGISRASFILNDTKSKEELTAKCLLTLLNDRNANQYLYFVYQKLRQLAKERDVSIVDKMLEQVILKLERHIQKNICGILFLIENDHKLLVDILKVCETEDRAEINHKILTYSYKHWVEWRYKQKHNEQIHIRDFAVPSYANVRNTMKEKLLSEILDNIIIEMKNTMEKKSFVAFLKTLKNNIKKIDSIYISFPPHYNLIKFYLTYYYKFITAIIMDKLKADIEMQDTIFVIKFIEFFKLQLAKLEKQQTLKMQLTEKQIFLMKKYVETATEKWYLWVNNIVQSESNTQEFFIVNDVPRVHCVQDLFSLLNHQFENITQDKMLPIFLDIVMLILKTLDAFHSLLEYFIDSNGSQFEDEYYCALINSIYDVSQKLTKYQQIINDTSDELNDEFDETISKFTLLAKHCVIKFAYKITEDTLQKNVFDILFTLKYFNDETNSEIINGMIETVKDYLQDLNTWIEEKYFVVSFCKCLVQIIYDNYIKALIKNQPRTSKLINFIRNDAITMNKYFSNMCLFEDLQFNKIWKDKYEYLMSIANALDIEDEFFDAHAEILVNDKTYANDILEYIKKKRTIQHVDDMLSNNKLRKLKHNKMAKQVGKFIQKTKEKKNNKKKQKTKKRTETF